MKPTPLVTISIVSHGDADKISRLLESLRMHEPLAENFQLILTDNLKNDLPELNPAHWESLHILRNEKQLGFAENHNRAFGLATGKYFAILNPDLVFTQPLIEHLIHTLTDVSADLIAPIILDEKGIVQDSFRAMPTPYEIIRRRFPGYRFEAMQPSEDGMIHPDWMAGMFWLMPSAVYRKLGGMDKKFRLYFEDVDFCTRARLHSMKLLVDPRVQIHHDAQRSSRKSMRFLLWHTQSALKFFLSPVYRRARAIR